MLVRWSPLNEVRDIERTVDRLFGRSPFPTFFDGGDTAWPRADVVETEEGYEYELEAPGLDKKDLKVELKENILTVSGEHNSEKERKEKTYLVRERFSGRFFRSFAVPGDIDEKKLKAEFRNGVLHITLPKTERSKAREIPIQVS